MLRLSVMVCLLIGNTMQEEIYFKSQPQPYHYSYANHISVIPCAAVRMTDAGEEIPIAAIPYRNSEVIPRVDPPERHRRYLPDGVVAGVVVNPTLYEDSGTKYHCQIERGGEVVKNSTETILLVGDGQPFVVREVSLLEQSLCSVTLDWTAAPVPEDAPVLNYEITLTTQDQERLVFTVENRTSGEFYPLQPGTAYLATVTAVNSHGPGNASKLEPVMTLVPEAPWPPTNVTVTVNFGPTNASLVIRWIPPVLDPEVMTPLTSYTIYYGPEGPGEELSYSVVVADGTVSEYTVTDLRIAGDIRVGVAAVNSAGSSPVTYYQYSVGVGCGTLSAPEHGQVSQTGAETGSQGNYSCEQGFTLSEDETRVCLDNGEWSGTQPTCNAPPAVTEALLSSEMIIIVPVAIGAGLVLVVTCIIIVVVILRRRYVKMESKRVIATGTFANASPPLKRQKPHSVKRGVQNNTYMPTPGSHVALSVLGYPKDSGTPTPPEPITFQGTPSPPSSTDLPPSYSNLEDQSSSRNHDNTVTGFSNHLHSSSSSPPSHCHTDSRMATDGASAAEESCKDTVEAALNVQYSVEPRAAGSSPSPLPCGQAECRPADTGGTTVGTEGDKTMSTASQS